MTPDSLPSFRYHKDPIATGSVVPSTNLCVVCERSRGYIYTGPTSAEEDLEDEICPWCIADGSACAKYDAEFTDRAGVGDYGNWPSVPDEVVETVACRTPGFIGWQQERWFTCCNDAAEFLGLAGREELANAGPQATEAIREEIGFSGEDWEDYLSAMGKDGPVTAYLFRCLHCNRFGGYSDFT